MGMPKRLDLPRGGIARKAERRRAERPPAEGNPQVAWLVFGAFLVVMWGIAIYGLVGIL
jgi:hypothetical protein